MIAHELPASFDEQRTATTAPVVDYTDLLARRYQQGHTEALGPLLRAVEPLVAAALVHARAHARFSGMPPSIGYADLAQHAALTVAELALKWDPDLGAFGAYLRSSLKWELSHLVRRFSASRGRDDVTVLSVDHDKVDTLANRRPGEDGRRWADTIALCEALALLSPTERRVVGLVVLGGLDVSDAARRMRVTRYQAEHALRTGLAALRCVLEGRPRRPLGRGNWATRDRDSELLARLLEALMQTMKPSGYLRGCGAICSASGLTLQEYRRLMARLVAGGVVAGSRPTQPGYLVLTAAAELLEELSD